MNAIPTKQIDDARVIERILTHLGASAPARETTGLLAA
jgi:hypothetical protein